MASHACRGAYWEASWRATPAAAHARRRRGEPHLPLNGQGPLPVGISYVGYGWGPYA